MGKIGLIIKREYITRVRKPAFIVMTLLGPVLFAAITVAPVLLAQFSDEVKTIAVVDTTHYFYSALKEKETEKIKFAYLPHELYANTKKNLDESEYYGILYIPIAANGTFKSVENGTTFESRKNLGLGVQSYIEDVLAEEIRTQKLQASNINPLLVKETETQVNITATRIDDVGQNEEKNSGINTAIGFILGFMIYIFIFIYGAMVMRGVIEEKTSRIVEIIMSSVKPFQLMMGKIIGIGLTGFTQFIVWIVLGAFISGVAQSMVMDKYAAQNVAEQVQPGITQKMDAAQKDAADEKQEALSTFNAITNLPFGRIAFAFVFYFVGGYVLYGAFFAAIGGAVDSETDSQQFMLPVTLPIVFSIVMLQFVLNNPDGPVAFWLSIIPLTSPVIMMVRIPFDPPVWQVALSMGILVVSAILSIWLAGRIYRTGILMYGKKPTWRELGKWLFYKG